MKQVAVEDGMKALLAAVTGGL